MQFKLISFELGTTNMILIMTAEDEIVFNNVNVKHRITPTSHPMGDRSLGYTFTIPHANYFDIKRFDANGNAMRGTGLPPEFQTKSTGDSVATVTGHSVELTLKRSNTTGSSLMGNVIITGRQTGASKQITVLVTTVEATPATT